MKELKNKLSKLRSNIGEISKNSDNPFYHSRYFDINELLKQLQPHLDELGLLLMQPITDGYVVTVIENVDGDGKIESSLKLPELDDPQKIGSAITYYRRYTLQSLLGLQAEDDDANKASGKSLNGNSSKNKSNNEKDDKDWLNKTKYKSDDITEQWEKAVQYLKENPENGLKSITAKYKVNKSNYSELQDIVDIAKGDKEPDEKKLDSSDDLGKIDDSDSLPF